MAARRVGQHFDHLLGLGLHGAPARRVQQPARALKEADRVTRGRRVQDDQVRRPRLARGGRSFHLLELAQDQHVGHPGDGGSDDVQSATGHQAPR